MVSDFPRKHAHSLQRLHSLAFDFGTLALQKTKLPRLSTVCSGKPDTILA